jgi:hypothetical protein
MNQAAVSPAGVGRGRARAKVANDYVTISVAGRSRPPLWLNPAFLAAVFILPLYCFASALNHSNYRLYGARGDFVTPEAFMVGLSAAILFIIGALLGQSGGASTVPAQRLSAAKVNSALSILGWLALIAYVIFLGSIVFQFDLVLALLKGQRGASAVLHRNLGRIPGVTSLMQLSIVGFSLLAGMRALSDFRPKPSVERLYSILLFLTVVRVLLASERLALIEAVAALGLAPLAFRWKPSPLRSMMPLIGAAGVFVLFCVAEYFRSWQYYKMIFGSYSEFIVSRFFGYFSTSVNNGAGLYITSEEHNPYKLTLEWLWKLPVVGKLFAPPESTVGYFLTNYASAEYNNPGGLFVPLNDYGLAIASVIWLVVGFLAGASYRRFQAGNVWGLLLFPTIFIGITDLVRIFYWSGTRTFPIFIGGILVALYVAGTSTGGSARPKRAA